MVAAVLLATSVWLSLERHKVDTQRVYRIGYNSDAPFHFRGSDGKPAGLAVEMVQAAARRRGIRLAWTQVPGSSIDRIRKGELDFWVLLTIRPERQKLVYLTDPYLVTETCFLVKADAPYENQEDLKTTRVSFLNLSVHRAVLNNLLPAMTPVVVNTSREAISAVGEGRADAAYLDQFAAVSALLAGDPKKSMKIVPSHAPRGLMGLASSYAVRDVGDQIRDEMRRMTEDGTMMPIVERWGFFPGLTTEAVEGLITARRRVRWLASAGAGLFLLLLCTVWLWLTLRRQMVEYSKLEQQLQQAQKLESLGRLAGGVAHDFNNLLTVINVYGDLLLTDLKQSDPLRTYAAEIRKAGERGAALTRQLLTFSRRQVVDPKPANLNTLVAESENMLRRVMGEDIEILTIRGEELGTVMADAGQIHQVLMNLAVNARDAMPAGGKLTIETRNVEVAAGSVGEHPDVPVGAYVLLTVTDDGIGMDRAVLERIFEPFFTTKDQGRGTGLGLSTVYGIVKQGGGFISAHSEPGCGTTFRIYLPRVDVIAAEERKETTITSPAGSETILLVEDQEEVRTLASAVLRGYGYRVLESSSGGDALALAKLHSEPIHLLLTDAILPGMTGRELAEQLQQLRPEIHVLSMSGYGRGGVADEGLADPGVEFIPKPFTAASLAGKVREVLDRSPGRGTILVVDDEELVRQLFKNILKEEGYRVLTAMNGTEALQIMRASHLDLVITDLVMPGSEGLETIQTIKGEQPDLKIVAMSGAFGGKFLQTAARLGACATLAKPISRELLMSTVRRVLG